MLGRRRAGKTVFLARLYEALWKGCTLVDGRLLLEGETAEGGGRVTMSCRATSGGSHAHFMKVIDELRAGRWPAATVGNSYAELVVAYGGRERILTALDYPGEVFRKAFMSDSVEADAQELLSAIDRAAAVILLVDPSVVADGGDAAHEDTFGLAQAAARIRASNDGAGVPIAVVLTKADVNKALLREAGGVRAFAHRHFAQILRCAERSSVFASAAVRTTPNTLGRSVPRADKPPENVVEPLRYCLELMDASAASAHAAEMSRVTVERRVVAEETARSGSWQLAKAWLVFAMAVTALLGVVGFATWLLTRAP